MNLEDPSNKNEEGVNFRARDQGAINFFDRKIKLGWLLVACIYAFKFIFISPYGFPLWARIAVMGPALFVGFFLLIKNGRA